jgi:hypothetical protein
VLNLAKTRLNVQNSGAPGGIRTPGLLVRSQALYPTELRARIERNRSNTWRRGRITPALRAFAHPGPPFGRYPRFVALAAD